VFSKNRNRKGDRDMSIASVLSQPTIITSSQTTTAEEQTAEDLALEQAEKEKVDFLNILLTQLSNQNPLDPMDTKDFTAQLTRYSILEQGIETNQKLSVTNDLLQTSASAASFDYIGKQVEVETNIGVVQNDEITWSYLIEVQVMFILRSRMRMEIQSVNPREVFPQEFNRRHWIPLDITFLRERPYTSILWQRTKTVHILIRK
jgi:hypothetical protein